MEDAPAPVRIGRTHCGKCGRAFRGDWDMYRRGDLTLCHICANQYQSTSRGEAPEAIPAVEGSAAAVEFDPALSRKQYRGVLDQPVLPHPDQTTAGDVRESSRAMRRYVMIAGLFTVVTVIALLASGVLDGVRPAPQPAAVGGMEQLPELPRQAYLLAQAIVYVLGVATTTLALYLLLRWHSRLPYEFLIADLIHIAVVVAIIQFLGLGLALVPCVGPLLHIALAIYILWEVYDLGPTDFAVLIVYYMILTPLVVVLRLFALGMLANLYM